MRGNPVTKRGLYRQAEPDPDVADLSHLIWGSGLSFKAIAEATGSIVPATVSRVAYLEVVRPRNLTRAAILRGLGYREAWIRPDGTEHARLDDAGRRRLYSLAEARREDEAGRRRAER